MIELKEFRFTCVNLDDTFTFYTNCLLMVLHKKSESIGKQYILFRYQRSDAFLRFEYSQSVRRAVNGDAAEPESPVVYRRPITSTDLLIYVMNIDKVLQRVRAHNYVVFVEPVKISEEIRACVLVDPNGIRIRLIESVHCMVDAAFEARIGYVSVPVREFAALSRSIAFYQQVFGAAAEMGAPQGFRTGRQITSNNHSRNSSVGGKVPGFSKKGKLSLGNDNGSNFTIRDTESFPEDMLTMVWLGNGPRATHSTLCLRHAMDRQLTTSTVSKAFSNENETQERFLGLVFVVTDLERCQQHLSTQDAFPVQLSPVMTVMGMSSWFSFFDPAFINVEIREEAPSNARHRSRLTRQSTQLFSPSLS